MSDSRIDSPVSVTTTEPGLNRNPPRLLQYQEAYAARFKQRSMAGTYELRPPYPDETFSTLLGLLEEPHGSVLDVGCGTGRIARSLVDHVTGVDAVDFSAEMIRVGRSLDRGGHPNLRWILGRVEEVELNPGYSLVTAGASIHWMDWSVVFPRFNEVLTPDGYVAIVEGDRPKDSPWGEAERELIRRYSTNRHFRQINLIKELVDRDHLLQVGDKRTVPINYSQTVADYVESFHSRESMSREQMGEKNARAFDAELSRILTDYVEKQEMLHFQLQTRVVWGRPLA